MIILLIINILIYNQFNKSASVDYFNSLEGELFLYAVVRYKVWVEDAMEKEMKWNLRWIDFIELIFEFKYVLVQKYDYPLWIIGF